MKYNPNMSTKEIAETLQFSKGMVEHMEQSIQAFRTRLIDMIISDFEARHEIDSDYVQLMMQRFHTLYAGYSNILIAHELLTRVKDKNYAGAIMAQFAEAGEDNE